MHRRQNRERGAWRGKKAQTSGKKPVNNMQMGLRFLFGKALPWNPNGGACTGEGGGTETEKKTGGDD